MEKKSYLTSLAIVTFASCAALFADNPSNGHIEKSWFFWNDPADKIEPTSECPTPPDKPINRSEVVTWIDPNKPKVVNTETTGKRTRRRADRIAPLKYDLFVDANQVVKKPDGSLARPFTTISDAISFVQAGNTDLKENRDLYTILVAGGMYDNEPNNTITISGDGLRINLVALGEVYLGSSDDPTSVFWEASSSHPGVIPMLSFSSLSKNESIAGFNIPDGITVMNSSSGVLDVSGSMLGGISSSSQVPFDFYLNDCVVSDDIEAPNANLRTAEKVFFQESVRIGSYGSLRACDIQAGMDIGTGWNSKNRYPKGILYSTCAGEFTSSVPGAILYMDTYTAANFSSLTETQSASIDETVRFNVIGVTP